jgi:hypothetical protein
MRLRWIIWKAFGPPDVAKIKQQGDFEGLLRIYSDTFLASEAGKGSSSMIESLHNQSIDALCQFPDSRGDSFVLHNIEFATEQDKPYYESAIQAVTRIGEQAIARLARSSYITFRDNNDVYHKRLVTTLSDLAKFSPALIRNIAQILDDGQAKPQGGEGVPLSWTSLEREFTSHRASKEGATLNSIQLRSAVAEALGLMNIVDHNTRSYVIQVLISVLNQHYQLRPDISIAAAKSLGQLKATEATIPLLELYSRYGHYHYREYEPRYTAVATAADDALCQIVGGDLTVLANESSGNETAESNYKMLHDAVSKSQRWSKTRKT